MTKWQRFEMFFKGQRRNDSGSMTIRPDFYTASQLCYTLPHSAQVDTRSLAGGDLRLSFLIQPLTFIAHFQSDFSWGTQQPHQRGRTS
jgi:hypothetical protein